MRKEKPFRIFVSANKETRVERVCKRDGLSREAAEKKICKMDKLRSAYYNEYADAAWGRADNYDLCMNLSTFNMDQAIEMIAMNYK
ncbi:MAG: cytidylate kinase family protein [Lachnospiraceae bacterium]|nr:cytidylate kinase family protein [Lachnospiraceae bacterium]